jgi:hypothetical protein
MYGSIRFSKCLSVIGAIFAAHSAAASDAYPFNKYAVADRYIGAPHYPDFRGRDREFKDYRTRIRTGVDQGAAFSGRYALLSIGCGTDCNFGYIVDLSNGRVIALPRGGEDFMDLQWRYRLDSALLVARWYSLDTQRCFEEMFVWRSDRFEQIDKKDVGDHEICVADWPGLPAPGSGR